MKRVSFLALAGALAFGSACASDEIAPPIFGDAGNVGDTGVEPDMGDGGSMEGLPEVSGSCPTGAAIPDEGGLMLPCCKRVSNADQLDDVGLRISSILFQAPLSIAAPSEGGTGGPLPNGLLQAAVNEERFNWLIQIDGAEGAVTVRTGGGIRGDDASFSLAGESDIETFMAVDDASPNPLKADPTRWNAATVAATYTTEAPFDVLNFDAPAEAFAVPVFTAAGSLLLELPVRQTTVTDLQLYDGRSCAGARNDTVPTTSFVAGGTLTTFVAVEDTIDFEVNNPPLVGPLCALMNQSGDFTQECDPENRSTWRVLPDSVCDDTGCTLGGCDGDTTCNAWQVIARISAAAVEVP